MLYAYFGGLGADKQATYELLLEYRDAQYTVSAIVMPRHHEQDRIVGHSPRRWLRRTIGGATTRSLYTGQDGRIALRNLFWAACMANLADHGQRFCYVLPSVPLQPNALAPLIPPQLRYDGSLPVHPQLWQVGRSFNTLPIERHRQACTDERCIVNLTTGRRSLDEGCLR